MSKIKQRKRIRKIKRIIRKTGGGAVILIISVVIFGRVLSAEPGRGSRAEKQVVNVELEPVQQEQDVQTETICRLYIEETETAEPEPAEKPGVGFVTLPVPMDEQDQAVVFSICQESGVAFPLVMAIIEHESEFVRTARSSTGDSGYMQINDVNADSLSELGFKDLFDLEQNVGAGVYILSELFRKYGGDVTFVLMAYNAGERGAQRMRDAGIYETEYTVEILDRAEYFTSYIDDALKE